MFLSACLVSVNNAISDLGSFHARQPNWRDFSRRALNFSTILRPHVGTLWFSCYTKYEGKKFQSSTHGLLRSNYRFAAIVIYAHERVTRAVSDPVKWPRVYRARFRAHTTHRVSHFTFGAPNKSTLLNTELCPISLRAIVWLRLVIENISARDRPLIAAQRPNDKPANVCENFLSRPSLPAEKNAITQFVHFS